MARARSRSETRAVSLGEDLRIGRAREVAAMLAVADAGAIEIDASKVARVDAAGLQAVVAGVARLRAAKVKCRWSAVSEPFAQSVKVAGLGRALGVE